MARERRGTAATARPVGGGAAGAALPGRVDPARLGGVDGMADLVGVVPRPRRDRLARRAPRSPRDHRPRRRGVVAARHPASCARGRVHGPRRLRARHAGRGAARCAAVRLDRRAELPRAGRTPAPGRGRAVGLDPRTARPGAPGRPSRGAARRDRARAGVGAGRDVHRRDDRLVVAAVGLDGAGVTATDRDPRQRDPARTRQPARHRKRVARAAGHHPARRRRRRSRQPPLAPAHLLAASVGRTAGPGAAAGPTAACLADDRTDRSPRRRPCAAPPPCP